MKSHLPVTIDMSLDDYEELLGLLGCCAEECAKLSVLVDLAADFRYFCELLKSNRR